MKGCGVFGLVVGAVLSARCAAAADGGAVWQAAGVLRWNPLVSSNWNFTQTNWLDSGTLANTVFTNGDAVQFDDLAGANKTATLENAVSPSSLVVTSSVLFTLRGTGRISGVTGIVKDGTGTLQLGGTSNDFTGEVVVSNGTLRAFSAGALGSGAGVTHVRSGAALDVNGQNLGGETVLVEGVGPAGAGALVNLGTNQPDALRAVRLVGPATFGGTGRFGIRGTNATLDLGGFTLTKTGTNEITFGDGAISNGSVDVRAGGFLLSAASSAVEVVVQVQTGAAHWLVGDVGAWRHGIQLIGGRMGTSNGSGAVTHRGPVLVLSNSTVYVDDGDPLRITNDVGGAGRVTVTSPGANGTLILDGNATNAGGWLVAAGTLQVGSQAPRGSLGTNAVLVNGTLRFERSDDIEIANALSGTGSVHHASTGTLRLTGPVAVSGLVAASSSGTLVFDGGSGGTFQLLTPVSGRSAQLQGSATLVLTNNAIVTMRGGVYLGAGGATNAGHAIQYDGAWKVDGADGLGLNRAFVIGEWPVGTNRYQLLGGTLTVTNGRTYVPWNAARAIWDIDGGTATVRHLQFNEGTSGTGVVNLTRGALVVGPGGIVRSTGAGAINLGGGRLGAYANWVGSAPLNFTGTNGATTLDTGTNQITLTAPLAGTGAVIKIGSGTMHWQGYSTRSGAVTVAEGTLRVNNVSNLGASVSGSGSFLVLTGATLTASGSAFGVPESNTAHTTLFLDGGTFTQLGSTPSHLRGITLRGAYMGGYSAPLSLDGDVVVLAAATSSLIQCYVDLRSNVVFTVADGPNTNDLWIGYYLAGAGWTKTGPGTMVFDGFSTCTGTSVLAAGDLVLNGQLWTDLVVAAGATLAGSGGSIMGALQMNGRLAPGGDAPGSLACGQLDLGPSALTEITAAGAAFSQYDYISVAGTATLAGTFRLVATNGHVPAYGDGYGLLNATTITGLFQRVELPPLPATNQWLMSKVGTLNFSVIARPDPVADYTAFSNQFFLVNDETGDDDADGHPNLYEYATGTHPVNPIAGTPLALVRTNALHGLRFTRDTNATDVVFTVERATSLAPGGLWTALATNIAGSWGGATNVTETGASPATVTVYDTGAPATNCFLRLRIVRTVP